MREGDPVLHVPRKRHLIYFHRRAAECAEFFSKFVIASEQRERGDPLIHAEIFTTTCLAEALAKGEAASLHEDHKEHEVSSSHPSSMFADTLRHFIMAVSSLSQTQRRPHSMFDMDFRDMATPCPRISFASSSWVSPFSRRALRMLGPEMFFDVFMVLLFGQL